MPTRWRGVVFSNADSAFDGATSSSDWTAAARVLESLRQEGVAVVICSIKSHAELEQIQEFLGSDDPCVVERGGAVVIPDGYFQEAPPDTPVAGGYRTVEFGLRRDAVMAALYRTAAFEQIEIVALGDLTLEEIALDYGIPLPRARQIMQRSYSERFRLLNPTAAVEDRMVRALRAANLECTPGDKFWQVDASPGLGPSLACLRTLYADVPNIVYSSDVTNLRSWARTLATVAVGISETQAVASSAEVPVLE